MTESGRGKRIAILIGTNEYSKMDKLEFAESDAREMGKVLLDPDICGFDEVLELINKNKEEVSKAIEKVFKSAKKDDQVLIYYSGHGKPSYKFDLCLLFKETDPDSLLATSMKFDYINECKDQSACNCVVVILDCCYSGTAGMKGDFLQEMLSTFSGSGTILLTSTGQTGSNIAKEDKELMHGVFTHYLLKGLKDWSADYDSDGVITVDDIYRYTFNETKAKGLQRPQIKGSYEGEVVLGRNPQKIKDREFELKKDKLMQYLSSAPSSVIHKSFTILQKTYTNPYAMDSIEVKIKPHLESLLNDEIQAETYVEIVKYQETIRKKQEEEQKRQEILETEKREKEEQEKLQKQREEELQRQKEDEKKKEKEFLERQQREEQERTRREEEKDKREKEGQEKRCVEEETRKEAEARVKEKEETKIKEKEETKIKEKEETKIKEKEETKKQQEELNRQRGETEQKQREEDKKRKMKEESELKNLEEAKETQETKEGLPRPFFPKKPEKPPGKGKPQTVIILAGIILGLVLVSVIWLHWGNVEPPAIESFKANPETVVSGENITLNWNVSNADHVTITPEIGEVELNGSTSVSPAENTTYTLIATNRAGDNVTGVVTVCYLKKPKIISFDADPTEIISGDDCTLSWNVSGDADVIITPEIGDVELSGSVPVRPTENTTYTIKATNEAGEDSANKVVTVKKRVKPGGGGSDHGGDGDSTSSGGSTSGGGEI